MTHILRIVNEYAIGWFAIPVIDLERARTSYSTLLGITARSCHPSVTLRSVPAAGELCFRLLESLMGFKLSADSGMTIWLNAGDDLQVLLDRVTGADGKVLQSKEQIGEFGYIAMILTPREPHRLAFTKLMGRPGIRPFDCGIDAAGRTSRLMSSRRIKWRETVGKRLTVVGEGLGDGERSAGRSGA